MVETDCPAARGHCYVVASGFDSHGAAASAPTTLGAGAGEKRQQTQHACYVRPSRLNGIFFCDLFLIA